MSALNDSVARSIEAVARESYGRLVSLLASRSADIVAAEDALSDAFAKALAKWPADGIPDNPEAWLLTAASRRQIDAARRANTRDAALDELRSRADGRNQSGTEMDASTSLIPDTRLRLMFVCTHPSIDESVRPALMMQTVLGLDASQIASAFLVKPSTMSARLVRAKTKIRDAAIPFVIPEPGALTQRVDAILEAIYAAYTIGIGFEDVEARGDLTSEAIWLASILNELMPGHPEAMGLQAMMMFHQARVPNPDEGGRYIPLSDRSTKCWDVDAISAADGLLKRASELQSVGAYQLEAAIQSVHCRRRRSGQTDWETIRHLYRGLTQLNPTFASLVGFAAATCHCGDASEALLILESTPTRLRNESNAHWAVLAETLSKLNRTDEANAAYQRAIGLTESKPIRAWLQSRIR